MSEAELHVLNARLRGGILNKVRRGEHRCPLPTGLVYDEAGNVTLDPDTQIRDTIAHFFETFARVGSACQTVKAFRREGLGFPSRRTGSATVFRPLTASTAIRVLSNPRLAGAYVYGRRRYRRGTEGKKHIVRKRDCGEWQACIGVALKVSFDHLQIAALLRAFTFHCEASNASEPQFDDSVTWLERLHALPDSRTN